MMCGFLHHSPNKANTFLKFVTINDLGFMATGSNNILLPGVYFLFRQISAHLPTCVYNSEKQARRDMNAYL